MGTPGKAREWRHLGSNCVGLPDCWGEFTHLTEVPKQALLWDRVPGGDPNHEQGTLVCWFPSVCKSARVSEWVSKKKEKREQLAWVAADKMKHCTQIFCFLEMLLFLLNISYVFCDQSLVTYSPHTLAECSIWQAGKEPTPWHRAQRAQVLIPTAQGHRPAPELTWALPPGSATS